MKSEYKSLFDFLTLLGVAVNTTKLISKAFYKQDPKLFKNIIIEAGISWEFMEALIDE